MFLATQYVVRVFLFLKYICQFQLGYRPKVKAKDACRERPRVKVKGQVVQDTFGGGLESLARDKSS